MVRNSDDSPEAKEWQEYVNDFFTMSPLLPDDIRDTFVVFLMAASTATLKWVITNQRLYDIMDPEDPASDLAYQLIVNELELRDAESQRAGVGS